MIDHEIHDGKPAGVTIKWLPRKYNAKRAHSGNLKLNLK